MKLDQEFYQVPLHFDAEQLHQEVFQFNEMDWQIHRTKIEGTSSIVLVSVGGTINDDFAISGAMRGTAFLELCPYIQQVIKAFEAPVSRSYLLRIPKSRKVLPLGDYNYHWFRRRCIYVPIVTNPGVQFSYNDHPQKITPESGEAWTLNHSQHHGIANTGAADCIYLVIETKGSLALQGILESFEENSELEPKQIAYNPSHVSEIPLETYCFEVLTPKEIGDLTAEILFDAEDLGMPQNKVTRLVEKIEQFRQKWKQVFVKFHHDRSGELAYQDLILEFQQQIVSDVHKWLPVGSRGSLALMVINSMLSTSQRAIAKQVPRLSWVRKKLTIKPTLRWSARYRVVEHYQQQTNFKRLSEQKVQVLELFQSSVTLDEVRERLTAIDGVSEEKLIKIVQRLLEFRLLREEFQLPHFEQPIFIVSAPRAGSTLLFETLSKFPQLWSTAKESHETIEGIPELHPAARNYSSNCLSAADVTPEIALTLKERFTEQLQNRQEQLFLDVPAEQRPQNVRFLEKTPKNSLRIPFLKAIFPEAKFIYLYRDPKQNVSSIIEGWRSRRFVAYRQVPGWPFQEWSFLLAPGWSSLEDYSIAKIATHQWKSANSYIMKDLKNIPAKDWCFVRYSDLVANPKKIVSRISKFAQLDWDEKIDQMVSRSLPVSHMSVSAPSPDKWRKNVQEINQILPEVQPIMNLVDKTQNSGQ
ncbi:sulfotransferase family protein [Xenococcus sp. PCC 7305]|uniref:sulfotransferase family protein n=1 Tax=Xenococcus sp. PCC 7305 TaxID=102125 RepID=UPI0002ABB9D4|nr:sulfotransferase [Xenococcus sp. PCC 7305]ELS03997.1 sulfotransferase family protein [Xenococcus sp. PCC 7305]